MRGKLSFSVLLSRSLSPVLIFLEIGGSSDVVLKILSLIDWSGIGGVHAAVFVCFSTFK